MTPREKAKKQQLEERLKKAKACIVTGKQIGRAHV